MPAEFAAEIVERTVVVTCPGDDDRVTVMPTMGWEDRAYAAWPSLHAIEGPVISGAYALAWRDPEASDQELLDRSVNILRAAA